jgi:hypothetical protein
MNCFCVIGLIAGLGTASLPAAASAQASSAAVDQAIPAETATQRPAKRDPHLFLAAAKQQLEAVPSTTNSEARKKLMGLREDFDLLVTTYEKGLLATPSSASGAVAGVPVATNVDWKLKFDQVERDLVSILGIGPLPGTGSTPSVAGTGLVVPGRQPVSDPSPTQPVGTSSRPSEPAATATVSGQAPNGSPTAAPAGSTTTQAPGSAANVAGAMSSTGVQPTGLAGVAVAEIGVKNLDPGIRAQLEEVRKSVELFYDATTSVMRP